MIDVQTEQFANGQDGFFTGYRARLRKARGIATPAVWGPVVVFGGGFGSHEVYALDTATGTLRWDLHTKDDGPTAAVVVDGVVLFNTESCTLVAADALTGKLRWEKDLGDPLLGQPAAADGRVVMVYPRQGKHWLGAFDIQTGRQLWKTEAGHDVITAPVIAQGHVYLSTYDGAVSCLDAATGHRAWTQAMNATSAPFVVDGNVYVAQRAQDDVASARRGSAAQVRMDVDRERTSSVRVHDGSFAAASAAKGAAYLNPDWGRDRKARFDREDAAVGFAHAPAAARMDHVQNLIGEKHVSRAFRYQGSRPMVSNGVIFETTGDRLEATDVASGELLWSWDDARPQAGERRLTPPAVANGRVLVGTWDGRLISFDATTGRARWTVNVGAPCHWQPVMAGGRVFCGLEDGSLVAFETGDMGDDGWPMWGGGPGHNGPDLPASPGNTDSQPARDPHGVMRVPAQLFDGHVVLHLGSRRVLLDTGSPYTLGRDATPLSLAGALVPVNVLPMFDVDHLSRLIGARIDVVLGNDVLRDYSFRLRLRPHPELLLAPRGQDYDGPHDEVRSAIVTIPFDRRATLPVCSVRIGASHESVKAIIDTGAVVSLAPDWWLRQHAGEPFGERHEFYLSERGWVDFDTPLWRVPIEVGGHRQYATFARIPPELAAAMRQLTGTDFLLGTDLFRHSAVDSVVFDAGAHEMRLLLSDCQQGA